MEGKSGKLYRVGMCYVAKAAAMQAVSTLPTPFPAQVNKDDLLSMVRYGAELVFSSDAANVTDAGQCCGCMKVWEVWKVWRGGTGPSWCSAPTPPT